MKKEGRTFITYPLVNNSITKEKTFNQEVEHFCRVLETEIKKKEN